MAKIEKDVEYKTKEAGSLNQAVIELPSDRDDVQSKHDAIHSYLSELKKQRIAKPETYAERKARREAERVLQLAPPSIEQRTSRNCWMSSSP